jgi:hypothetical protein
MTPIDVKKALYREKPFAYLNTDQMEPVWEYQAWLEDRTLLTFKVPVSDMGEKKFNKVEPAQLLIRWLVL